MLRKLLNVFRTPQSGLPLSTALAKGDLVSVAADDGLYAIAKVLEKDAVGIHVRLYAQRFTERPAQINPDALDIAPFGPEHDAPFSIGHMPMAFATFDSWEPRIINRGNPVGEDELEGYRIWQEGGGYL